MVIYACHAGLDTPYLKKIAKLLRIRVESFSKEIRYHPVRIVGGRIIWKYSAGAGNKGVRLSRTQAGQVGTHLKLSDPAIIPSLPLTGSNRKNTGNALCSSVNSICAFQS